MWIILSLFNIICAYFAEKNFNNNKVFCISFLMLIIISNTIILGLRDFGVGTDTLVYIDSYYDYAKSATNLQQLLLNETNYDKGYIVIAYIATLIGNSSQMLLILTELFIITFIVLGIYRYKKILCYSMTWFVILYVLRYQNVTVNLMRQFCAMALLFYGFSFFLQKKYITYVVIQIIAYFFHTTSLLFIIVPFIHFISSLKSNFKYIYTAGMFLGILLLIFFYFTLLTYFGSAHIVQDVYVDRYGIGGDFEEKLNMGMTYIPLTIIPLIIFFIIKKEALMDNNYFFLLVVLYISTILLEQMRFVQTFFYRMGYYSGLIMTLYLSNVFRYKEKNIVIINVLYLALMLFKAYSSYGYSGNLDINMVYSSKILGI